MTSQPPKTIVIAGAGCAGLSAGIALLKRGFRVIIYEKSDRVGGLAGGIEINGNTYEYGPHIFHTTDPEILEDVKKIAGHVLLHFDKSIKIKFLGKYFDFPLSIPDILLKLPFKTVLAAMLSFAKFMIKGVLSRKKTFENSEKALQRYYGDVLYKLFFKDYITKVWGIEPTGMAASFAMQRIPRFDLFEFYHKFKIKVFGETKATVSTENYVEKVEGENYTTEKGFALIAESFASEFKKNGGELHLGVGVMQINVEQKACKSVSTSNGKDVACDHFISTVPISLLPAMISPKPAQDILSSASELKFRAITFVGILVKKEKILPASFMYFRDKSFNRITDLGQFKVKINPPGATILIAEITCQPGDEYWNDESGTQKLVVQELVSEGLLSQDDVLETHLFRAEHGYPIYTVGYEKALEKTLHAIGGYKNIHTVGRQGKFAYINTHIAMKMGYEIARKLDLEN